MALFTLTSRLSLLVASEVGVTCPIGGMFVISECQMDVAKENHQRLMELAGEEFTYTAVDRADDDFAAQLLEHTRAEKRLVLKRGAQVMLLKVRGRGVVLRAALHRALESGQCNHVLYVQ